MDDQESYHPRSPSEAYPEWSKKPETSETGVAGAEGTEPRVARTEPAPSDLEGSKTVPGRRSSSPPDSKPRERQSSPPQAKEADAKTGNERSKRDSWFSRSSEPPHDRDSTAPGTGSAGDGRAHSDGNDGGKEKRKRVEKALRESIRWAVSRGMEAGAETFLRTDKVLRGVVDDVKLPKELASYVLSQIDETRSGVVRIAAREVRTFLEGTDLASEMRKVLTSLSFEVTTQVRFVPNESGDGIKPDVKASLRPKKNSSAK